MTSPLASALTRYRVMAYATGVLLLLLTLHVVLQVVQFQQGSGAEFSWAAVFEQDGLDAVVPGTGHLIPILHGWLYLIYVVTALDLWQRTRLPAARMALVVLAGTVPVMSFVAERWVRGRVLPMLVAPVASSG